MYMRFRRRHSRRIQVCFIKLFANYSFCLCYSLAHYFNSLIMSEEGNPVVNLSHTTSIDTIWDFEIQGIENEESLPLTGEHSDDCESPSTSALSTAPSGLLTPTLGSNTVDGSSSGGDRKIYERRRKIRKSWVYFPENGGEYLTPEGRTRWRCARCKYSIRMLDLS